MFWIVHFQFWGGQDWSRMINLNCLPIHVVNQLRVCIWISVLLCIVVLLCWCGSRYVWLAYIQCVPTAAMAAPSMTRGCHPLQSTVCCAQLQCNQSWGNILCYRSPGCGIAFEGDCLPWVGATHLNGLSATNVLLVLSVVFLSCVTYMLRYARNAIYLGVSLYWYQPCQCFKHLCSEPHAGCVRAQSDIHRGGFCWLLRVGLFVCSYTHREP